jgi:hypothetical protein
LYSPGLQVPATEESPGAESPGAEGEEHAAGNGTQGSQREPGHLCVGVVAPGKEVPATGEEECVEVACWVGGVIPLEACRVADVGGVAVMRREGAA